MDWLAGAGEPRPANFLNTNVDQDRKIQLTTTICITRGAGFI